MKSFCISIAVMAFLAMASVSHSQTRTTRTTHRAGTNGAVHATPAPEAPKPASDELTSQQIIDMVHHGLSEAVVINTIKMAPKKAYNVPALIALKDAGISDRIINAFAGLPDAPAPMPAQVSAPASATTTANSETAETATVKQDSGGLFGRVKKLGSAAKNSVHLTRDDSTESTTARTPATGSEEIKVKDREAAIIRSRYPSSETAAKLKSYFDQKGFAQIQIEPSTGQLTTGWGLHRHCGIGIYWCESRAVVDLNSQGSSTQVKLRVMDRKHEGGLSEKPWNENADSNGKSTSKMANELQAVLN